VGVHTLQANFTRGELTPYLHARADTDHYAAGLTKATNIIMTRFGGFIRSPGTLYGGATKSQVSADKTYLIPFRFNRSQVYAIEAGDEYFRFWVMGSTGPERIESGGSPVEVATPYATADLPNLKLQQSADVIYLFCDGYQPRTLTRNSETSWTLETYDPLDGPYMPVNVTSTTLTPAETGSATPKMTSNTAPSSYVASNSLAGSTAYLAYDRDKTMINTTGNRTSATSDGFTQIDLGSGNAKVVDAYWLVSPSNSSSGDGSSDMPTSWQLQGSNDGSTWTTLDGRDGETGWSNSETRFFSFENDAAFRYYKVAFSGGGGNDGASAAIAEVALHQKASDQTPFNLTASDTTGINGDTGFQTSDVGRAIRLFGSDGKWRWAKIVSRTSDTVVTIRLYGHALPDTSAILLWQLGAWCDYRGWPKTVGIYEDRIMAAGSDSDPTGIWGTRTSDYDNYGISDPLVDDDGVAAKLTGGEMNAANWMVVGRDILIGTDGSIRAVGRNDTSKAFAPSNIRQRTETAVTTSTWDPLLIEQTYVFSDGSRTRLFEAIYSYNDDGYVAQELSTLNEHLFQLGVTRLQYQASPHRLIWSLRDDGKLIVSTYDKAQKVFGSSVVDVGGTVEDILSLPGSSGDDLFLVVKRTVDGSTVRYIEGLAEFWRDDFAALDTPIYGACSVIYDGVAAGTITGLDHLEGEAVGVWADGLDFTGLTVSGGEITLPNDITAAQVVVGLRMSWEARTMRLTQHGNQDGTGLGRPVRIATANIDLYEAAGLTVGSLSGADLLRFEDEINQNPFDPMPLRTGMFPLSVDDDWSNNGQIVMSGDKMYPVTVRGISLDVEGAP